MSNLTDEKEVFPPSRFAALGNPSCSCWGKSEIEWIALAYVQALANDGDTWKKLSKERVVELLTDEQRRYVYPMLTDDFYDHWFKSVQRQIADYKGALGVGGFWNLHRLRNVA